MSMRLHLSHDMTRHPARAPLRQPLHWREALRIYLTILLGVGLATLIFHPF